VEEDVTADSINLGLLGADGVVFQSQHLPQLVEEFSGHR